ncbi:MAG: DUF4175 family protein [Rhizomicrobium sp.]|jgi:uncharacterized protein (TIGR02302 family)
MTNLLDTIASRIGSKPERSERYVALARAAILWERVWVSLWPATGVVGLYLACALLGVVAILPATALALLQFAVLATTGYLLYRSFRTFSMPGWALAARRVERDSALSHRPLTEGDDRLLVGAGHSWTEALWRAHLKRLLAGIARLRIALPSPGLPARDPYAIRYGVLLLLLCGVVVAGSDWRHRLALALTPAHDENAITAQMDAWINPPAYTGEAPIYLQSGNTNVIDVPVGSELALRVHAADTPPSLRLDPAPDSGAARFTGTSSEYGVNAALTKDTVVSVGEAGVMLGHWRIRTIPDAPPVITFAEPPSKTERGAVKFAFTAGDDYGVVSARALIRPVRASKQSHAVLSVDLPLPSAAKTISQTVYSDLTGEPFAGLDVTITLEATDGAGQKGFSNPVRFLLPARIFANPLARALIEQRQNLAIAEPNARRRAARVLDALTLAPEHFYANQANIYLAIRAAYWSLNAAKSADDITRVQDLLWQTAVAMEDAGVLTAAQQLRQIQQMLSQALAQGAPQSVVDALLDRYRQALQRYMQALAQNAQKDGGRPPPNARTLSDQDIEAMLKAIQQMAQTGSREKADEMLAMLQGLLENLHMSNGSGKESPDAKALGDAIQGLDDLMGHQRQQMDKSFRQGQGAGDPHDGGPKGLADQQGKLRDDLDKITKGLGAQKLPQPGALGDAGRAMGNAQNQLGSGDVDSAGQSQKAALDALRQASNALAKELMKRNGQNKEGQQGNEDPLGRSAGAHSNFDGGNLKLPDQSELARARTILEELRKRASQQGRPKQELDYIDRLLKEF